MGAETFYCRGYGPTLDEAFNEVVARHKVAYGHSGYTGTIAEKETVVIISDEPHEWFTARAVAVNLIRVGDSRIDDKWGPAGAIRLDERSWLFFGWASS